MKKYNGEITNKVLLQHMQGMKYELQQQIQSARVGMKDMERRLSKKIDANTEEIKSTRKELTERIDALDEDLTATIQDTNEDSTTCRDADRIRIMNTEFICYNIAVGLLYTRREVMKDVVTDVACYGDSPRAGVVFCQRRHEQRRDRSGGNDRRSGHVLYRLRDGRYCGDMEDGTLINQRRSRTFAPP